MSSSRAASAEPSWGCETKSSRNAAAACFWGSAAAAAGIGGWSHGAMRGPPEAGAGAGGGGGTGLALEASSVLAAVLNRVPPRAEAMLAWPTETETPSALG